MSFKPNAHKDDLLFVPLGGCNEIGVNVNLYHYKGKWIMIDCGAGFADEYLPGVDMIVADIEFIEKNKKDLLGIILTHAHEDHLGGIQYLWSRLGCPIYTTEFTANFLRLRLSEYSFAKKIKINKIKPGEKLDLNPFSIEMLPLTHSAPEMQAMMIRTDAGNILHTGDWKFDPDPIIGEKSDLDILKAYGDEGVLALVCDSTNVFNKGASGSEGDLREHLVDIIAGCDQLVVTTTFASNLARLDTLIHAAQKAGRKVALLGRSLHRMYKAAQDSGYLNDTLPLADEKSLHRIHRNKLLIIATGCQGEAMAATAKLASGTHPYIKLSSKDKVIFSSKIIPGNEKKIFRMFNSFVKQGIEVVTERDHFVHVSGHPGVEDLTTMYELVRPKICIPVHGEPSHLHEHVKLAKKSGIPFAVAPENGSVVLINESGAKIIDQVVNGYLAVDGNYLLPADSSVFKMRRNMRDCGIVVVTLLVDKKGKIMSNPVISMPGIFDAEEDAELIEDIKNHLSSVLSEDQKNIKFIAKDQIEKLIRSSIRQILKQEINKNPKIIINIEEVLG